MKLVTLSTTLVSIAFLVSCGGGGGGGGGSNEDSDPSEGSQTSVTPDVISTGTITPSNVGNQTAEPLNRLKGSVKFTSQFYDSSSVFEDTASFVNIETVDGVRLLIDRNTNTACSVVNQDFEFLCAHVYTSGSKDFWYFDVGSNGVGTGEWEYCSSDFTTEECTNDLINTPDGSVQVSVTSSRHLAAQKLGFATDIELITNDVEGHKHAGDLQSPSNRSNQESGSMPQGFTDLVRTLTINAAD